MGRTKYSKASAMSWFDRFLQQFRRLADSNSEVQPTGDSSTNKRSLRESTRLVVDSRPPFHFVTTEDQPDLLDPTHIYLIGDGPKPWSASFICPCGCRETISLSLIPNDRPRWRATTHADGTLTLSPSVWRIRGCKSHFVVRRGKIFWARAFTPI